MTVLDFIKSKTTLPITGIYTVLQHLQSFESKVTAEVGGNIGIVDQSTNVSIKATPTRIVISSCK